MSNQKIAGLLMSIATSEKVLKEFAHFIKDAHPDNAVHLTALLKYVRKRGNRLEDSDFNKKKVFTQLFPKEEYIPSRIDKLYSKAIKLAEDFLIGRVLQNNGYHRNFLLAKGLNDLQLNSLNILNRIAKYPYDEKLTKEDLITYYEAFNGKIVYANWLKEKITQLKR